MRELRGKVAVVTGAASGIGRAMAERFAADGMKVVLADVEPGALAQVESALKGRGAAVLAVPTDVTKVDQVEALARRATDAFGGVHVLCNNAGVVAAGLTWEVSLADWEWVLGVNLWGVVYGIRTFVPLMLRQDTECHIVNTASMAGLVSSPFNAIYNVTKFSVVTLSETLAFDLQLASAKIKVSVLCPGWVNTRILDAERNRPTALPVTPPARARTPGEEMMEASVRQLLSSGLDPAKVAGLVVDAIRDERFYILTHPEWKNMIRSRMEAILAEQEPGFTSFA
jgi:NAD(P)-dependent dehydrogenase (short-subunit alcohol dehydrogenase family)